MYNLNTSDNSLVTVSAKDTAGNPAPVTIKSFTIDNHALAYAVQHDASSIWVVSIGPVGSFNLTVVATSAGGVDLTAVLAFTVIGGDASSLTLSPSVEGTWNLTIPGPPVGW